MIATAGKLAKKSKKVNPRRLTANGPSFQMVKVGEAWHIFENAAVPTRGNRDFPNGVPIYRGLCEKCKHVSSYLMLRIPPTVECDDCRTDRIASDALRVQEECGVDLGWKTPEFEEREKYVGSFEGMQVRRIR